MTAMATWNSSGVTRGANGLFEALMKACPTLGAKARASDERVGAELVSAGRAMPQVYFPTEGVLSIVVRLASGGASEVMTVGNEGMVGLSVWLGLGWSIETVVKQAEGEVMAVPAGAFTSATEGSGTAQQLLAHYAAYALSCTAQTCVCNAHHSAEQRACRWLLSSADRAGSNTLNMTQTMLAEMIAARRQTVGEVVVGLRRAGLIDLRRQRIELLDRAALERRACECYGATRAAYRKLVAPLL